jgi:SAM-dependent methyltransferase
VSYNERELDAFANWERAVWTTRAAPYAKDITSLTRGAADALLDAAAVSAGSRVLDVGTGPGVVALAAKARGADVIGVDQAEAMVAIARAAGVDARPAAVEQLPFADASFDAVVAGFLINHLARPARGIAEMARVCRGWVAVSVWDVPEANPALGLFGPVVQSVQVPEAVPPGPDSDLYADGAQLVDLLETAGLVEVSVGRVRWGVTVDAASWFDAVAAGTPRTGAVLAAVNAEQRAALRERYVKLATSMFGSADGAVTLPAAAVVGRGRSNPGDAGDRRPS